MKLKMKEKAYHRNGIGGEGFHVVKFVYIDECDAEYPMTATIFKKKGQCAVLQDNTNVDNAWRGDEFEKELREYIKAKWL